MVKERVYIDSCLLIVASKGNEDDERTVLALEELNRNVQYLFSSIVELETIPKTIFHKYPEQTNFLVSFFSRAERVDCTSEIQGEAISKASIDNLGPGDALHVACAISGNATELVTCEGKDNTLTRTTGLSVRTILI